jgi:hypothetical protein
MKIEFSRKNIIKISSFVIPVFVFLFVSMSGGINAQCSASQYNTTRCWGACASGWVQTADPNGAVPCCAFGAWPNCSVSQSTSCGCANYVWCRPACSPVSGRCGSAHGGVFLSAPTSGLCSSGSASSVSLSGDTYSWSCRGSCGGSTASCSATRCRCWCNTCNPPSCPSGTSTTNTGSVCKYGDLRNYCGYSCNVSGCSSASNCYSSVRSCWYVENNPAPSAPTAINIQVAGQTCDLGNSIRIPYPNFGNVYSFLARGAVNNRASDPIRGYAPQITYQYTFLSNISPWLNTTTRHAPNLTLNEGNEYSVSAQSRSINRCNGYAYGGSISRNFVVSHVPTVVSIEPVKNPNDGVSGNIDLDASKIIDDYDCDIDNPKVFRVVFEDLDGCGDIWSGASANTNICGGAKTRNLSLRAVHRGTNNPFVTSTLPQNISCSGNRITADFTLTFQGTENFLLDLQAFAADIVGNTSGWVQPSGAVWSYDGQGPSVEIDSSVVMGADQLNVDWSAVDNINTLSGIQNVRILSKLTKGTILLSDDYYGPITYKDSSVPVHGDFDNYVLSWDSGMYPPSQSRNNLSLISSDLVDIGVNQDGALDFKIEAVDRACNFSMDSSPTPLGSPWIATRGGFVYSQGNINLSMRQSSYDGILGMLGDELTALSTELASSGGGFSDDILGNPEYVYTLSEYSDANTRSWYDVFKRRALARDPDGNEWSVVSGPDLSTQELEVCKNRIYVYFVDNNLIVNPSDFEDLAPLGSVAGCIFVAKGDITITDGEYKSGINGSEYTVGYDILRGYFIADGEINIQFVDEDKDVRDGLKVVGGLFASGGSPSIRLGRSLQLRDNLRFPTLIVFHDARYFNIGRQILGDTFGGGYVRDIGMKE